MIVIPSILVIFYHGWISVIIIDPPSQSGQVIASPTHIREIFQDVEGASQIFAESPQFDQDTTKSLMEVMMKKKM